MNIWIEYWKSKDNRSHLNNHAQMKENAKWIAPDPKDIARRFCQNREEASKLAQSLSNDGYHVSIKQDGIL